jgi:hypothetical protein
MRLLERDQIDIARWDQLVESCGGLIFSKSVYLDAVAESWCVYVDDSYSRGVALPYALRLGKKTLYTPLFLRCLEWFGELPKEDPFSILRSIFPSADFSLKNKISDFNSEQYIYQEISVGTEQSYNDLAKRMLRKFGRSDLKIKSTDEFTAIFKVISNELPKKVDSINHRNLNSLFVLIQNLSKTGMLRAEMLLHNDRCVGGAFFIETKDRVVYLKSAFTEEAKKMGAMYGLMDQMIKDSVGKKKNFDFGGSRVEGVKRFNHNLGASDVTYFNYKWNDLPLWYRLIKKAKSWMK